MRPRGRPPTPSARSSASDPVDTAPTDTAARSFIFITAPLPKFRSIWPSAVSSACSRSTAPPFPATQRDPPLLLLNQQSTVHWSLQETPIRGQHTPPLTGEARKGKQPPRT